MDKKERIALITGGANGICLKVARLLSEDVGHIVVLDKDRQALSDLAALGIRNLDGIEADVAVEEQIQKVFDQLRLDNKLPNILVNGVGGDARNIPFESLTQTDLEWAILQNVVTAFNMCRHAMPHMAQNGWGRVVNFASVAGRTYTLFSNTAYVVAKSAVIGLTKQLAYEYAAKGVIVNAVAHGPMATERVSLAWERKTEAEKACILNQIPMGRLGTVAEATGAVLHLCSPEAAYTTGAVIDVNGGMLI